MGTHETMKNLLNICQIEIPLSTLDDRVAYLITQKLMSKPLVKQTKIAYMFRLIVSVHTTFI